MPEVGLELHSSPRKHRGIPENMPSTSQSGGGTAQSGGKSVHIVHTPLFTDLIETNVPLQQVKPCPTDRAKRISCPDRPLATSSNH
ncbi:hypothetical protein HNP00_003761 [Arthrobacter sp. AZCC_0090]|nr:hypothetical protein [Arthrobacter sp. AZCC_0090]